MNGFKLLAIRPLKDCNKDYLKVLQEGKVYKFYRDYRFQKYKSSIDEVDLEEEVGFIINNSRIPEDMFDLQYDSGKKALKVNVSAVVGKNGSGKSSLTELIYLMIYCLGTTIGKLRSPAEVLEDELEYLKKDDIKKYSKNKDELLIEINREKEAHRKILDGLKVSIYYELSGDYYEVRFDKKVKLKVHKAISAKSKTTARNLKIIDLLSEKIEERTIFNNLFYSIAVNYSHYSLNSDEIGNWITRLFHKNDGYQTPLVLNPKRDKGVININSQEDLLNQRLQAILLEKIDGEEKYSLRNLADNKIVKFFKISSRVSTYLRIPKKVIRDELTEEVIEAINSSELFGQIISRADYDKGITTNANGNNRTLIHCFTYLNINYIVSKLEKIAHRYMPFYKYRDGNSIKDVKGFLQEIKSNNSHITFKVKRAILFQKYFAHIFDNFDFKSDEHYIASVADFSDFLEYIKKEEDFYVNAFMLTLPPFFKVEIILDGDIPFSSLSSGERQRIHSVSSIVYHLINLNSIEGLDSNFERNFYAYEHVNIILDEIELYYHPEWQREYLHFFLKYLERINRDNISALKGINLMLITHSPFILSDIPSNNILKLEIDAEISKSLPSTKVKPTFGANIHDLLADDFFMVNCFMGELAKYKIEETITILNYLKLRKNSESNHLESRNPNELERLKDKIPPCKLDLVNDKSYTKRLINLIGEPMLKIKLEAMWSEIFEDEEKRLAREQIQMFAKEKGLNIRFNDLDL